MGVEKLSSRAVQGMYFLRLAQAIALSWVVALSGSKPYPSDMETEEYGWLGQVPGMREWIGGRQAKGLRDQSYQIRNKKYESTIEFKLKELRRDKSGQVEIRINEHVDRADSHWAELLTDLLNAGEAEVCYDGQYFFDTDHEEGDSGQQSNLLSIDVATPTAPTAAQMSDAIFKAVQQLMGFKDDQGKSMNSAARKFLVLVPTTFMQVAASALSDTIIVDGGTSRTNTLVKNDRFSVEFDVNPDLDWTDGFVVVRTDSQVPPMIRQEEDDVEVSAKAEGSEFEFDYDAHQYGLRASRAAGFGFWQFCCKVKFT